MEATMFSLINFPLINDGMRTDSRAQNSNEILPSVRPGNSSKQPQLDTSQPSNMPEKDLSEAIASERENLLLFQLMKAIAQQAGKQQTQPKAANFSDAFKEGIEASFNFSFSSSLALSGSFESTGTAGSSSAFFNLSFTETTNVNLHFSIDAVTGDLDLSLSFSQSTSLSFASTVTTAPEQVDPLIINLSNQDFQFDLAREVSLDLDANGTIDSFYSPGEDNFFLALDKNSNGFIDDGRELFGDADGFKDGFTALAQYDFNLDKVINSQDPVFNQLLLMSYDKYGEQKTKTIKDSNITSISLNAVYATKSYQDNNQLIAESSVISGTDEIGWVGDFLITVR